MVALRINCLCWWQSCFFLSNLVFNCRFCVCKLKPWKEAPDNDHRYIVALEDSYVKVNRAFKVTLLLSSESGEYEEKPVSATVHQAYLDCQAYVDENVENCNYFLVWVRNNNYNLLLEELLNKVGVETIYNGCKLVALHSADDRTDGPEKNYLIEWARGYDKKQVSMLAVAKLAGKPVLNLFPSYTEKVTPQHAQATVTVAFKCDHNHTVVKAGTYVAVDSPYYLQPSRQWHGVQCRTCECFLRDQKISSASPLWICENYNRGKSTCNDAVVCNGCFRKAQQAGDDNKTGSRPSRKRKACDSAGPCTIV